MEVQHLRVVPPAISHPRCLSDLTLVLAMPPSLEAPPPPNQMPDTLGLFHDHVQRSGLPEGQVPQVDTAGVASSVRPLHSLQQDRCIIAGSVPHQSYTVLEAAPVLGVPHRDTEFGVIT